MILRVISIIYSSEYGVTARRVISEMAKAITTPMSDLFGDMTILYTSKTSVDN